MTKAYGDGDAESKWRASNEPTPWSKVKDSFLLGDGEGFCMTLPTSWVMLNGVRFN
jgi:hypothetical protein